MRKRLFKLFHAKEGQNIETLISENKAINISINKENKVYRNGTIEFLISMK